jgi:ASC-1-like (ASCH) protein
MLIHIRTVYLNMIRNGSKPVEGRMNEPKYAAIFAGQKITFYDGDDSDEEGDGNADSTINLGNTLEAEVVEVRRFKGFKEMLQAYGVEAFLPDFNGSLDEAVEVYRGFEGYREGEEEFGACAIKLMVL